MVTGVETGRYAAFISYSHKDAAAARVLHSRLERYRIPKRLVGTPGEHGPVPARLTPIFRDRDELPAAGDLSEKVREALAASDSLVVLCSLNSAGSIWVAREIAAFRELNPQRPVLAAVVAGEPGECFPEGLGGLDAAGTSIEPLAADLRKAGDGQRLGFLKLVAGLTGVGLDALVQRDAARAIRRVTAVTLTAIAATLVMAVLTIVALNARREADGQRAEAEKLVTFMLGELRRELKGVGRLDAMSGTNRAVLDYYERQPSGTLTRESRLKLAQALQSAGEDDINSDKIDDARARFQHAYRVSGDLLAAAPNDPERIFTHAQSEFWIATVDYRSGKLAEARAGFERYKTLAQRLVRIAPGNPEWRRELAYAEGSLCAFAFETPVDPKAALTHCGAALAEMEKVAARRGKNDPEMLDALVSRHAWAARAWRANARPDKAIEHLHAQIDLAQRLTSIDPANRDYGDQWVRAQMAMAEGLIEAGRNAEAHAYIARALASIGELRRVEPANARWRALEARIQKLASGEN